MIEITTKYNIEKAAYINAFVYKIKFDNGYFYIGRTNCIKERFINHKTSFKNLTYNMNKSVFATGAKYGEFVVLKRFRDGNRLVNISAAERLERDLILLNANNPYCINKPDQAILKLNEK